MIRIDWLTKESGGRIVPLGTEIVANEEDLAEIHPYQNNRRQPALAEAGLYTWQSQMKHCRILTDAKEQPTREQSKATTCRLQAVVLENKQKMVESLEIKRSSFATFGLVNVSGGVVYRASALPLDPGTLEATWRAVGYPVSRNEVFLLQASSQRDPLFRPLFIGHDEPDRAPGVYTVREDEKDRLCCQSWLREPTADERQKAREALDQYRLHVEACNRELKQLQLASADSLKFESKVYVAAWEEWLYIARGDESQRMIYPGDWGQLQFVLGEELCPWLCGRVA